MINLLSGPLDPVAGFLVALSRDQVRGWPKPMPLDGCRPSAADSSGVWF